MDEKLTENKLNASMHKMVVVITLTVKIFLGIFFIIFRPADKIKKTTHICMPLNADATQEMDKN